MCESAFNTAGERHGMCESALRRPGREGDLTPVQLCLAWYVQGHYLKHLFRLELKKVGLRLCTVDVFEGLAGSDQRKFSTLNSHISISGKL
jgi:hypothetical protein